MTIDLGGAPSMNSMQKTDRAGVNIRVALASGAKTAALKTGPGLTSAASPHQSNAQAKTLRSFIKSAGRKVARHFFRVVKPFGRPIVFRLRAYFTNVLHQEIQQAQLRTARELDQHARRQHQLTERLLSVQTATILQAVKEAQKAKSSMLTHQNLSQQSGKGLPGVQNLIQKMLLPNDTFVDVGSGVGPNILAAHVALCGQGRIVTFEPPSSVDTAKNAPLQIDDVLGDSARVNLIRIDAGGAGLHVLEGAAKALAYNAEVALIIEFDKPAPRQDDECSGEWLAYLEAHGFACSVIDSISGMPLDGTASALQGNSLGAVFSARANSLAWVRARGVQ